MSCIFTSDSIEHELARFALFVEAFAAAEFFAGRLAFFAFFQALDRELEVDQHVGRGLVALVGFDFERFVDDQASDGRQFRGDVEDRLDVAIVGLAGLLTVAAISAQRGMTGEHLIEDRAGEIDVAARVVHLAAGGAFEAGVKDGAAAEAFDRFFFGPFDAGQAEVDELRFAVAGKEDVRHLEVAVRDAVLLQRVVEAGHHAFDDMGGFEEAEAALGAVELAEVSAFDEVHHDVVSEALRIDFVDFDDVRMFQLLAEFAFAAEQVDVELQRLVRFLVDAFRIAEAAAKHLDGEHLAGGAVDGAEDAGEGAGADAVEHFVVAVKEAGARFASHQLFELILRQAGRGGGAPAGIRRAGRRSIRPRSRRPGAAHRRRRLRPTRAEPVVPRFLSRASEQGALGRGQRSEVRGENSNDSSLHTLCSMLSRIRFIINDASGSRCELAVVAVVFSFRVLRGGRGIRRVRGGWLRRRTSGTSCRGGAG